MPIFRAIAAPALLMLAFAAQARPAEPVAVDVWTAGEGGYAMYRIPGLVVTAKGTLLAYCEARQAAGDWGNIDLLVRRSTDGGATWQQRGMLAGTPEALLATDSALYVSVHQGGIFVSDDGGATWRRRYRDPT